MSWRETLTTKIGVVWSSAYVRGRILFVGLGENFDWNRTAHVSRGERKREFTVGEAGSDCILDLALVGNRSIPTRQKGCGGVRDGGGTTCHGIEGWGHLRADVVFS